MPTKKKSRGKRPSTQKKPKKRRPSKTEYDLPARENNEQSDKWHLDAVSTGAR